MAEVDLITGPCAVVAIGEKCAVVVHGQAGGDHGFQTQEGDFDLVVISEHDRGEEYCDTALHEWLHVRFPDMKEKAVKKLATQIAAYINMPEFRKRAGFEPLINRRVADG